MHQIINLEDQDAQKFGPLVLALGFFDGVHLGHQKILSHVVESAARRNARPAVFTFQEHPQKVLRPDLPAPFLITTPEQRLSLLEKNGIEVCFFISFTEKFSQHSAEAFVQEILIKRLHVKKLCLGYNAHFGKDREGNASFMKTLAPELGIEFEEIGPVNVEGETVSSSRIRKLISEGRLKEAEKCLGRPFSILGKVVKGDGRGAQLGFPTANLESRNQLLPPEGVYPVEVVMGPSIYKGVLNYGKRPTFKSKTPEPVLEVHLLDFNENLYGKVLEVYFHPRLRGEQSFTGAEALKAQILKDIQAARQVLSALRTPFTS